MIFIAKFNIKLETLQKKVTKVGEFNTGSCRR